MLVISFSVCVFYVNELVGFSIRHIIYDVCVINFYTVHNARKVFPVFYDNKM